MCKDNVIIFKEEKGRKNSLENGSCENKYNCVVAGYYI